MNTCNIKSVEISNLWGVKTISTDFYNDVNIFIGLNGTSKTTFLNLIEATLLLDIGVLSNIDFDNIIITLESDGYQKICLRKQIADEDCPILYYSFNDELEIDISCSEFQRKYRGASLKNRENHSNIKEKLNQIINISWLSVYRDNIFNPEFNEGRRISSDNNLIDLKLRELMQKLLVYQLQLESESNKISNKFKEDVFSIMLFNEEYDKYDPDSIQKFEKVDPKSIQTELFRIFGKLGVAKDKRETISKHITTLTSVISKIKENKSIEINDVFPLSLINRTLSLIEISKENESLKNEIYYPIDNYKRCIKKFISDKNFEISNEKGGLIVELKYKKEEKTVPINISSLSSGEKQLLILLTETLLQQQKPFLFIADEPELSLHIDWQRKIISSIRELNPNAQVIVATHSPEIAGLWNTSIINMENITKYGD